MIKLIPIVTGIILLSGCTFSPHTSSPTDSNDTSLVTDSQEMAHQPSQQETTPQFIISKTQQTYKSEQEDPQTGACSPTQITLWQTSYHIPERHLTIKDYPGGLGIGDFCDIFYPSPWARSPYQVPLYYITGNKVTNYTFMLSNMLAGMESISQEEEIKQKSHQFLHDIEQNPHRLQEYTHKDLEEQQYLEFMPYHKALVLDEVLAELELSRDRLLDMEDPQFNDPLIPNPHHNIYSIVGDDGLIYFFKEGVNYYYRLETYPDG